MSIWAAHIHTQTTVGFHICHSRSDPDSTADPQLPSRRTWRTRALLFCFSLVIGESRHQATPTCLVPYQGVYRARQRPLGGSDLYRTGCRQENALAVFPEFSLSIYFNSNSFRQYQPRETSNSITPFSEPGVNISGSCTIQKQTRPEGRGSSSLTFTHQFSQFHAINFRNVGHSTSY